MRLNLVGAFERNFPFGTEIAFAKGLRKIGVHVTTVDPSRPNQQFREGCDATIVFKHMEHGPYRDMLARLPGKKILYQVDDLRFPHIRQMMDEMRQYCQYALTFDADGAMMACFNHGYVRARMIRLTADNTLYRHIPNVEKDIDVCFVGSITDGPNHRSRIRMARLIQSMPGIYSVFLSGVNDTQKICELYNRSKVVLNHATDIGQPFGHGYGYQCRHFEAGMTRTCVLSNVIDNDRELKNIETFSSEMELTQKVRELVDNRSLRERTAAELYWEINRSHLPEHRAQEIVEFIRGL